MRLSTYLRVAAAVLLASPMAMAQSGLQNSTLDRASSAAVVANGGTFKPAEAVTPTAGGNGSASLLDLTEGFDDITTLAAAGWSLQNLSAPVGTTSWFQGNATVFPAQSGPTTAYIGANFNSTGSVGTISNWLITPQTALQNGTTLKFFSRTTTGAPFPDRLEVRLSTAGASTNVGATATSTGDFTTLLLTINPTLGPGTVNYPDVWTEYTATVSGLAAATNGRFAFRYFVTDGGQNGANSNFIGIDNVRVVVTAPVGPTLAANPTSLAFGTAVTVGQPSAPQTVTLTNGGTAATTVTGITSSNAAFTVTAPAFPLTIASSASATFTVRFTPTNTTAQTGNILVASNAPGSPLTIAVTGTGAAPTPAGTFPSTDTPLAIPDNVPAGITSTIIVPATATGNIADLDVSLNITHTWVGDLVISLARGAQTVSLADRPGTATTPPGGGCSANNMVVVVNDGGTAGSLETACTGLLTGVEAYTSGGQYTPNTPLSVFNSTPRAGSYVLTISDNAGIDVGTLNSWSLIILGAVAGEGTAGASASRLSVSPNPLAGQGQVNLTVGTAQDVRVSLYDALGREVQVLLARSMQTGEQAYIGFTTSGLPSGVYVVRATGTNVNLTQRVTVVR